MFGLCSCKKKKKKKKKHLKCNLCIYEIYDGNDIINHVHGFKTKMDNHIIEVPMSMCNTAQKMSKYGVFSGPYSVRIRENTDQKKLRIWTLFTQCKFSIHIFNCSKRKRKIPWRSFIFVKI